VAAIGSVWKSTAWSTIPWAANTWADAQTPAPVLATGATGGFIPPELLKKAQHKRRQTAQRRAQEEQAQLQAREERIALLRQAYDRAQGITPSENTQIETRAVAEVIRPFAKSSDQALPPPPAIDWTALAKETAALDRLACALSALARAQAEEDEAIATTLLILNLD
jgi:hypothetical protein